MKNSKAAEALGCGAKPQGVRDGSPPAGSRGEAPVGGLGTKSPEAEEF